MLQYCCGQLNAPVVGVRSQLCAQNSCLSGEYESSILFHIRKMASEVAVEQQDQEFVSVQTELLNQSDTYIYANN